jgi:hypothetical protein
MAIEISLKKSTANPTSASGLTLAEPVFNYSNNTLWIGKGSGNSPVWVGAGVCGASGGIAAGLTTQLPTHAAVKNYFDAVSSSFLGATVSYVATFNGATGAVTGVSSFNGLTGAVTGASLGANTFTGLQTLTAGLTTSFAHVSGGLTVGGNLYVNGNLTVSGGVTTSISEIVLIEDNIITLNSNVTGTPTENAGVEIERGTSANTQILWNESTDKWTFTNDGTLYYDIPTDYVSSFNGLTGAVGGVTTSAANTFTALQSFAQGVSSAGGTFDSLTVSTDIVASGTIDGNTFITPNNYRVDDGFNYSVYGLNSLEFFNGARTQTWNPGFAGTNTTITFPAATTGLAGLSLAQTFTALNSFNAGISAAGATLSGTVTAPTPALGTNNTQVATTAFVQNEIVADTVTTFNGRTGAVQGVSAAVAGTGISVSGITGSVTITNIGVQSFNGLTGAVTGVTVGGVNTFTALNSFNAGISAAGGTFSALTRFTGGITTSTLHVSGGATFAGPDLVWFTTGLSAAEIRVGTQLLTSTINSTSVSTPLAINNDAGTQTRIGDFALAGSGTYVDVDDVSPLLKLNCPLGTITIGDVDGAYNGTSIEVNDASGSINLNGAVSANSLSSGTLTSTGGVHFGTASAFVNSESTTLGTTAANQNIAGVAVFDGSVDTNRSVEFFIQASHSSGYEALKILAIHDGTNTYNAQYGLIRTGSSLCSSYTTTITTGGGGNKTLRLRATPTNTNTTFKVIETVIPA